MPDATLDLGATVEELRTLGATADTEYEGWTVLLPPPARCVTVLGATDEGVSRRSRLTPVSSLADAHHLSWTCSVISSS
jgi:hypothetical protein